MDPKPNNGYTPSWWTELADRFVSASSHAFGLSGAINDYVVFGYQSDLRSYLARQFSNSFSLVIFYDAAAGVRFGDEVDPSLKSKDPSAKSMRQLFGQVMEIGQQSSAPAAVQALRAATGGSSGKLDDLGRDPTEVLPLLDKLLRLNKLDPKNQPVRSAIIVDYADAICSASDKSVKNPPEKQTLITLERWGHDPQIISSNNLIVLITASASDVNADLRSASSRYTWIDIPLPVESARLAFIKYRLGIQNTPTAPTKDRPTISLEPGLTEEGFASSTAGLMKAAIEDIVLTALHGERVITRSLIKRRKDEVIRQEYGDVVSFLEAPAGLDALGGLDHVKTFLRERVVRPIQEGKRNLAPSGVLFLGPPGTGKSFAAAALAYECGFNAVLFNPANILNKYVGESERNLERLLTLLTALRPCMIFVDEIDQRLQRGTGDSSQVINNIFSRFLEFSSLPANRGSLILLAASNKPLLIDPALVRAGRFEYKIPFLPPNRTDRRAICLSIAKRRDITVEIPDTLIDLTDKWTGAELEKLIDKANNTASIAGRPITPEDLLTALRMTRRAARDYDEYVADALAATEDIELLPPEYQEMVLANDTVAPRPVEPLPTVRGPRRL